MADGDLPSSVSTRETINQITLYGVADTKSSWPLDRSSDCDVDFGIDNVFFPVTVASRNIAGKNKIWKGGHGNVMCPSHARFQHASAPHGNGMLRADVMGSACLAVAAHAPQLQINDPAGAHFDCRLRVARVTDAFVQADSGVQAFLQLGVGVDVIPLQGLLNHEQIELVERPKMTSIA